MGENSNGRLGVGFANGYAEMPLNVSLSGSLPTITITAGDGQSVTGGVLSGAFTVTVTDYGSPAANTWVYFAVPTSEGSLVLSPTGTQFSPIIGVETNSQGVATVYLQGGANTSGPVQIIASSGSSQTTLSAIVALAGQAIATDTPTMPEWMLIILAGLLFLVAVRRKSFLARL
ncbi:MAG: IPTL-CTERM sorting domain-containing protein [Verrucomicrobiota bacterium]